MKQPLTEYLEVDYSPREPVIRCIKCGHIFCGTTENYRNHALMKEKRPHDVSSIYAPTERVVFREFYCPGCGTLLNVEIVLKDSSE